MNQEEQVVQEEGVSTPSPVSQPISYARQNRAERLKQAAIEPDFVKQKVYSTDEILKDYVTNLDQSEIDEIVRSSGIKGSLGEQAAVAVQNALMSYNSMTEYNTLSGGNTINYFTGNNIGDEWRDMGYEAMLNRKELMEINEESVGGVRNWLAKLAGGATSMGQMALEGFATAGVLPMAKMALESYGEGTFNDLKKYADEHEGSLEGYEPKGVDLAINTANGFIQAYIERKWGVASPRFLTGWSRGFWKEGVGGIVQEFSQSEAEELAEVAKGNMEVAELLDNVLDNLIDATVAFPLQGALGAISNGQHRKRADAIMARARAISRGVKEPTKEDYDFAKKINDAKERELASALTTEFKAAFDESTGEGKLQKKIAGELKRAVEAKELDLDTANETELAQRIEQIATQETLTAIEDALEKGESVSELALNNIVYKDGSIWLEGLTPELGDKAVGYARVLAERQSGLAEARNQLDAINAEIKQTKADLVQAQQEKQESRVKVLQARIAKQNALAEKNRIRAEKLEVQTAKLEKQIAKATPDIAKATAKTSDMVGNKIADMKDSALKELASLKLKKAPVAERKSLKQERINAKEYMKKVKQAQEEINRAKRIKIETKDGVSILEANKELLDSVDIFTKNDILRSMMSSTKISSEEIDDIFNYALSLKNSENYGEYFSNLYYDISVKPNTSEQTKKDAKQEYEKILYPSVDDDGLLHQAKPVKEVATQIQQQFDLADENARLDDIYPAYTGDTIRIIDPAELKQAQYEVIQRTNPMQDEYHVGIRSVNDIKTFDETIDDKDSFVWGDYSQEDAKRDLAKNEITIYSSKPIENGVFVSTSYRQAQEYAGGKGAKVYKKTVPLDYVAWISGDEGQFAITDVVGKKRSVYNSNGERIAKSEPALRNFYKWFGDSKVVDEQGRPLVVYHGSNVEFDTFDKNKGGFTTEAESALYGFYFTSSAGIAESYANIARPEKIKQLEKEYQRLEKIAQKTGKASDWDAYQKVYAQYEELELNYEPTEKIYNVYLKIENPMEYDFAGKHWEEGKYLEVLLEATNKDNDGVIFRNSIDDPVGTRISDIFVAFEPNQIKSVDNRGTFSADTGNILKQGSISGKGDTNRGGYDDQLKRIILGEKSDLSTIQHEFAHYWIQNNFKWARSGLASQDWLRRWRDVEEWLGIEPQDRLLSKSASEKFAKAYERYILEGKVAPELQWAFEGFQKAYQDIYSELENEYFDLSEELAPEVVDWFNSNKEQSPKRLLEADTKKIEKQIALSAGASVIEDVDGNVIMTEQNKEGDPVIYMGVKESEIPAGDNLLVQADKTTASKLQQSAKRWLSDKVEVQQLTTLDTQATLENFKNWIARDRQGAWDAMMNPDTRPIYRTYLYKAFAQEAMNNADLAVELANIDMGQAVREMGQAIQALDIRNESGFDTLEIMRNIEKSKGKISTEELNKEVESIGLDMIELSQADIDEIEFDTECKL